MSIYRKQSPQTQFLKFGVDSHGIIVPILRRGKDQFVKLPPRAKPAEGKNPRRSKDL